MRGIKKNWVWILLFAGLILSVPAFAQDKNVEDITEEILTGPSDLDPEKILGPGGISIKTHKDLLMSFGATVRLIPTAESNFDFGMSDNVPGYFYTEPVKGFAGNTLNAANALQDMYNTSITLNNSIVNNMSDATVIDAFKIFNQSYIKAHEAAKSNPALEPKIKALASSLDTLNQAVSAMPSDAEKAALIKGSVTASNPALKGANLLQTSDALAAGFAKQVNKDNSDTAADLTESIAYLSVLKATADSFNPYYLSESFLRTHTNESGSVNDGYIRSETKLYFNAMPKDKKWSFYAALEYDRPLDNATVDNRGGKDGGSNFGLERLNASVELVDGLRLHGGWDVWGLDVIESASMVYGDDNPGFWIKGDYEPVEFSIAWLKLEDNDFQNSAADHGGASDQDRDLLAGYMDYKFRERDKVRFFYGYDRIRNVPSLDLTGAIAARAGLQDYAGIYGNNGLAGTGASSPDTDAHTIGAYYLGSLNIIELMLEGAYKFGSADDTGLAGVDNGFSTIEYNDFDISAYAFAADIAFELKSMVGWESFKPHFGVMYTSGDDDPYDDKLSGFTGITSGQRFSRIWGGENTIIGDTNFLLGSALYGYIPELYGNGTPVFTGGLQNMAGTGSGRGDNPGMTMFSAGITLRPKVYLIYKTNANMFYWNEDFSAANMVTPINAGPSGLTKSRYTTVEAGYVGTEWDNEITLALNKNMFIKTQASFFFPGETIEDVSSALSGGIGKSDDTASRLAMEFIWNF